MIIINNIYNIVKSRKVLLKVLSSSFLSLPVSIAVSFVTYRLIDPCFLGIWATMTIVEVYSSFTRMGVINGMNRELPFARGEGREKDAKKYAETTLFYTLVTIFLLIIITPFVLSKFEFNSIYLASIIVVALRIVFNTYSTYLSSIYITSNNFNRLSNIQFIMIGCKLVLCVLVYFFAYNGYLMMQLLLVITNALMLHSYRPIRVKPRFNKHCFLSLVKVGFPIFLSSYAVGFIGTFPKVFILNFGNERLLGLYSPVLMVVASLAMLPTSISTYFYPRFSYILGKENNALLLWRKLLRIFLFSFLILVPFMGLGYIFMDDFIMWFPKFKESLPYLKIILLIGPFVLAKLGNLISVVLKQLKFLTFYVVFYGIFQITYLAFFYLVISKDVLYCAAWSQVCTFFSLFVTSLLINRRAVKIYQNAILSR